MSLNKVSAFFIILSFPIIFAASTLKASDNIYEVALTSNLRSAEEIARDAARKPDEVLAFYGVDEGMTVLDLSSGSGYYTKILSATVGENGRVIAQNSASNVERNTAMQAYYQGLANVDYVASSMSNLPIEDNSVDRVLLFLMYHHLHYKAASAEAFPPASATVLAEIKRVLKPNGVLGVIEHLAPENAGRAESAAWHRVSNAIIIDDMEENGFELVSQSDIFLGLEDNMACFWRNCAERGQTNRLVHAYSPKD